MEKEVKIALGDGHAAYGTLVSAGGGGGRLVVFVHGFTGHRNEHIFFNAARRFAGAGFDSFRFDLYAGEKDSRRFRDTKISQHGADVTEVVRHFREQYEEICVVGHSYGGTSLLFADQSIIDAYVFWDASYIDWPEEGTGMEFDDRLQAYILDEGVEHIVGKDFVDELKGFPDCGELIAAIRKPVLFVTAGAKGNAKAGQKYMARANEPKKLVEIGGADQCFNGFDSEDRLIGETLEWLSNPVL